MRQEEQENLRADENTPGADLTNSEYERGDSPPTEHQSEVRADENTPGADLTNSEYERGDSPPTEHRSDVSSTTDESETGTPLVEQEQEQRRGAGDDLEGSPGVSLFPTDTGEELRGQWNGTQSAFVDDPRAAVARADQLVVQTIQTLSTSFSDERSRLEEKWGRGESVTTEDLRVVLQLYRSFFDRLLSI